MTVPGPTSPAFSAASIIASAGRSFTLPLGFFTSSLPTTDAPPLTGPTRESRTSGVFPTSSSTLLAIPLSERGICRTVSEDALVDFDGVPRLEGHVGDFAVRDVVDTHRRSHRSIRRDLPCDSDPIPIGQRC